MRSALAVLLAGYIPGALLFRLPIADRARRASLSAEERLFWSVILSVALSSCVAFSLAAMGLYRFERLLTANGLVSLAALLWGRQRLRFGASAPLPTWTLLIPCGLAAAALWFCFFVPPAEYVMGGKDPGVYMNEGIQIGQRGSLVTFDQTVASVPAVFRDLFFPTGGDSRYYSNRFMGFFLLDPVRGAVVDQFPHLYPTWIAIAYGVNGLSGARWILGLWSVLGVLAVYFLGARIAGRAAGAAGAGLLAVHVLQVWYARYPNAELVMQPLVFAGVLACVRAHADGDDFFAPVAAVLLTLSAFAHLTGLLVIAAVAVATVLGQFGGQRLRAWFAIPLVLGACLVPAYFAVFLPPYFAVPLGFVKNLRPPHIAMLALSALIGILVWWSMKRPATATRIKASYPVALVIAAWVGAAYAFFFRTASGPLAPFDADALRTFTAFYLSPIGLLAALLGFSILVSRSLWASGPFLVTLTAFSFFFFYKLRIVPQHFWVARRFLAVILPGSLLLIGAAAFSSVTSDIRGPLAWLDVRGIRLARYAVGLALVLLLGWHFHNQTNAILRHVEYAGLIPRLEQLAATVGSDDLVVVESRNGSDTHVLALPLAYIYGRNVLVIATTTPDRKMFREFLAWAHGRYRRVFFFGGGGTELLSRNLGVKAIRGERFQIPEYESSWNAYPTSVRFKEFDFGIYEFLPAPIETDGFDLDLGVADDVYVRRFHAKEQRADGFSFRWTRDVSYVSIVGTGPDQRNLTMWLGNGGRPPAAGSADVAVFLNNFPLGTITVGRAIEPYHLTIPAELAVSIARSPDAAQLRLESRTWNPQRILGTPDARDLGVMIDRIEVR